MRIFISTSDSTMHILPIFAYLFNKYWPNKEVTVLGFAVPDFELPDNFTYVSVAPEQKGGASNWTKYLKEYFNSIDDTHFIFGLDDSLIVRKVSNELYDSIVSYVKNDLNIGRFDLTPGMRWASVRSGYLKFIEGPGNLKLVECIHAPAGVLTYRLSAAMSIWNRDYFLKSVSIDRSPWAWELEGGLEAEHDSRLVLGCSEKWCIRKTEGLSNAQFPGKINTFHMKEDDIKYIVENNLIINKNMILDNCRHEFEEWAHLPDWELNIYDNN